MEVVCIGFCFWPLWCGCFGRTVMLFNQRKNIHGAIRAMRRWRRWCWCIAGRSLRRWVRCGRCDIDYAVNPEHVQPAFVKHMHAQESVKSELLPLPCQLRRQLLSSGCDDWTSTASERAVACPIVSDNTLFILFAENYTLQLIAPHCMAPSMTSLDAMVERLIDLILPSPLYSVHEMPDVNGASTLPSSL